MNITSNSPACLDRFEAVSFPVRATLTALVALYWITAGTANTLNVIIMAKLSYHFPTWPNLTICLLSVADFVTVMAGLLPTVVATAWKRPLLCEYPELCDFQGFFLTMTFLASFCMLGLISFDRFTAICCPFWYNRHIARNRPLAYKSLLIVAGVLFLFCSLAASVTFLLGHRMVVYYPGWYCFFNWRGDNWATYIPCGVHASVSTLVVLVLGVFTSGIIVAVVRMKRNAEGLKNCGRSRPRRVRGVDSRTAMLQGRRVVSSSGQRDLETVFARVAITTTTVHTVLGLPFIIRLVLSLFGVELREMVDLAFVVFLMLHAAVNPILYGVVRRTVRRTYWWGLRRAVGAILCSKRCRPRESLNDILGITSNPTTSRRPSSDYVCRPVGLVHRTRDLPHIHIHPNPRLQTIVEGEKGLCGGRNTHMLPATPDGVCGKNRSCNSILLPSDSQYWNINFDLRRSTLASLPSPTQLQEEEENSCDTHCSEERLHFSLALGSDEEERECIETGLSHLAPRAKKKRVIILQHHKGTPGVNKTATEA